jgi:hypothetical protein
VIPEAGDVLAVVEKLENFIDESAFIPASHFYRSRVLLALLSKALTVSRALCALVEAGFFAEAFGMSRTLVDLFLSVRYIGNRDTEARAKKFADYFAKAHEKWTGIIEDYYPERKDLPMPDFHDEAMKIAKEFKSGHQWTGLGGQTKIMALEEDAYEFDPRGEGIKHDFDYNVIYWWTSQYVHGTVVSLQEHAAAEGSIFHIRARVFDEKRRGYDALFNALIFLSKMFVCAFRAMNADQPEEILGEVGKLAKAFAGDGKSDHT